MKYYKRKACVADIVNSKDFSNKIERINTKDLKERDDGYKKASSTLVADT